jgi:hypothetical protein
LSSDVTPHRAAPYARHDPLKAEAAVISVAAGTGAALSLIAD